MSKKKKIIIGVVAAVVVVLGGGMVIRTMNNKILTAQQAPNTLENMKAAVQGETTAYQKYIYFAEQAGKEGNVNTQKLFLATADAELIHINKELAIASAMDTAYTQPAPEEIFVGSSAENLQSCINGEKYEAEEMYPEFLGESKTEKFSKASTVFRYARDAEASHAVLFADELQTIQAQGLSTEVFYYYMCPVCGKLEKSKAPFFCSVCGTPGLMFEKY